MNASLIKLCVILFLGFMVSNAQEIDNSFNNGNLLFPTISVLNLENEKSRQVLIQDDNKIITISHVSLYNDFSYNYFKGSIIERYNSDGTLDLSYGDNGRIRIPHVSIKGKILSDGKLLIGSIVYMPSSGFQYYIGFVKLDNNGNYDNSFGSNGVIATQTYVFNGFGNKFTEFEFSDSGNIYLLYWNSSTYNTGTVVYNIYQTTLHKFTVDCQLDTTFGDNGHFFLPSNTAQMYYYPPSDVLEDNQGNVYLSMGQNQKLLKLSNSGVFDTSFGNFGIMNLSNGGILKFIQLPNSKFLCSTDMNSLVRYNSDFTLDTNFGNDGILNDDNKSFDQFHVGNNNNIFAIGKSNNNLRFISRYTENGVLDTNASDEAVANISFSSLGYSYNFISDFKILSDNKIILYGSHDLNNNGNSSYYYYQRFLTKLTSNLLLDNNDFQTEELDLKVYPNPFNDYFDIYIKSNDYFSIDLFDIKGRFLQNIFKDKSFSDNSNSEKINLSNNLSKGIYFIKLKSNFGLTKTIKIYKN